MNTCPPANENKRKRLDVIGKNAEPPPKVPRTGIPRQVWNASPPPQAPPARVHPEYVIAQSTGASPRVRPPNPTSDRWRGTTLATTQPTNGLEEWIRRPPNRAAPTTLSHPGLEVPGRTEPHGSRPPASLTAPGLEHQPVAFGPNSGPDPSTHLRPTQDGATTGQPTPEPARHMVPAQCVPAGSPLPSPSRFPVPGSPSKRTMAALARNNLRIQEANDADQRTILGEFYPRQQNESQLHQEPYYCPTRSAAPPPWTTSTEYLPPTADAFLPDAARGPDDTFIPPAWFLSALTAIACAPAPTPMAPPFRFEVSPSAVAHNGKVLARAGFDVGRVLADHQHTTLGYGCEFREVEQLRPLLGRHRHFPQLADLFTNGMSYHYKTHLSESERQEELEAILARGNHKSATTEAAYVSDLLAKDVIHGFSVPIPLDTIRLINGAAVQPLGIAIQKTLDEWGTPKVKRRLTQDLTFSSQPPPALPRSINSRIDMTQYPEMVYGWCLPRTLHFIAALRLNRPNLRILIAKYDYSDAYRRIAHSATAAPQTIAVHDGIGYLALRLTFGGCPNPPSFCGFSELTTDLSNEIGQCKDWDPKTLHSPVQPVAPKPIYSDPAIPIALAQPMAVGVLPIESGMVDCFIDDLINVFWDTPANLERAPHIVPLAMHVTSRPHAGDEAEPLPRRGILSAPKLKAEGAPAEIQTVLGWSVDTRCLTIRLPDDKFEHWAGELRRIADLRTCTFGEMESMVGRLGHTSYAIPLTRHFLDRLNRTIAKSDTRKSTPLGTLTTETVHDLRLWETFLVKAHKGVSLNLVVTRKPTRICWSDACPFGIGGYSLTTDRAWRVRIPKDCILFGHPGINNLLEFLGMVVNVWLECQSCNDPGADRHACILAIGDNTSAIGWLHKSASLGRDRQAHVAHLVAARHLATIVLEADCCLASQHIKGVHNVVADLLSYVGNSRGKPHPIAADDPPDDALTTRFHSFYPEQIPANFVISHLPVEVSSWLSEVLQMAALSISVAKKAATKTATEPGGGGPDFKPPLGTLVTPSSLLYPSTNKTSSSKPFSKPCGQSSGPPPESLTECVRAQWLQTLCAKPQATWVRRFGGIANQAPSTSRTRRTCDPLSAPSSLPSPTLTLPPDDNEQSPPSSCVACSVCPASTGQTTTTPTSPSSANSPSSASSSQCAPARPPQLPSLDAPRSSPSEALSSATSGTKSSPTPIRRSARLNESR